MNGLVRVCPRLFLVALLALALSTQGTLGAQVRFEHNTGGDIPGDAPWLSVSGNQLARAVGTQLRLGPSSGGASELSLALPRGVIDGVLAGKLLILSESRQLLLIDLALPGKLPVPQPLAPAPGGAMHLAQMDDYLVVAEDGYGLRVLALPVSHHTGAHQHHRGHGGRLVAEGQLPMSAAFAAIAVEGRTIFLALRGQGIAVVDASSPSSPVLVKTLPFTEEIADLAASGSTLYALRPAGLTLLDPSRGPEESPLIATFPELGGQALHVAGRRIWISTPGLGVRSFFDRSAAAATFAVAVGNNFFNPNDLTVQVGDSVEWTKTGGGFHNVFSCIVEQSGCNGLTATEVFSSGDPTSDVFTFLHTFGSPGSNPYVCQIHNFTMLGNITVGGAPCEGGGDPNTSGYYRRLCIPGLPPQPDPLTQTDVDCVNDSCGFASVESVADLCAVLDPRPPVNRCARAERELLALLLNACRGQVCGSDPIQSSCSPNTTVEETMAMADEMLCGPAPKPADCTRAACMTKEINSGRAFDAD